MATAIPPTRKARRERIERERAQAAAAARRRRLVSLGAVLAAAAIAVAGLIAVSSSGSGSGGASPAPAPASSGPSASGTSLAGAGAARRLLAGIPQHGVTLGRPDAPVRVVEFADLQCPFCRAFAVDQLPALVRDYVRPGKVRMDFRSLTFIGADSERAARVAEAAAGQDRLWDVVDLLYANQGRENSGWATDALLRRVVAALPGLDARRVFAERGGAAVTARLREAATLADRSRIESTPTFLV